MRSWAQGEQNARANPDVLSWSRAEDPGLATELRVGPQQHSQLRRTKPLRGSWTPDVRSPVARSKPGRVAHGSGRPDRRSLRSPRDSRASPPSHSSEEAPWESDVQDTSSGGRPVLVPALTTFACSLGVRREHPGWCRSQDPVSWLGDSVGMLSRTETTSRPTASQPATRPGLRRVARTHHRPVAVHHRAAALG
jgi:hypothetical protein